MATYDQIFAARNSPELLARFVVALEKAAFDILNEDDSTPGHQQRIALARKILWDDAGSQKWARRALNLAMVSNATLQEVGAAATDQDVQFIVNGLIDMLTQTEAQP